MEVSTDGARCEGDQFRTNFDDQMAIVNVSWRTEILTTFELTGVINLKQSNFVQKWLLLKVNTVVNKWSSKKAVGMDNNFSNDAINSESLLARRVGKGTGISR